MRKLVGISVLYAKRSARGVVGEIDDCVVSAASKRDIDRWLSRMRTEGLGKSRVLLGLYDAFTVVGPLGNRAMLGRVPYPECRTRNAGLRLLGMLSRAGGRGMRISKQRYYVAEMLHFFNASPRSSCRVFLSTALVSCGAHSKRAVRSACIEVGRSSSYMQKVLGADGRTSGVADFLGLVSITPLAERPRIGLCYRSFQKRYTSVASLRKILPDDRELPFPA